MRILQDFLAFLLMRTIGRWVRRLVRLLVSLLLVGGGSYALYQAGSYQLESHASVICRGGGDVLDAVNAVHASPWRHVVRDPCWRGDLAVGGCWGGESP